MQEISAIMGLSQLSSLDSRNQKRSINAEYFKKNLPEMGDFFCFKDLTNRLIKW
jgi:dTDP-4-amino-4,6-dideoxygalactose transaminase